MERSRTRKNDADKVVMMFRLRCVCVCLLPVGSTLGVFVQVASAPNVGAPVRGDLHQTIHMCFTWLMFARRRSGGSVRGSELSSARRTPTRREREKEKGGGKREEGDLLPNLHGAGSVLVNLPVRSAHMSKRHRR